MGKPSATTNLGASSNARTRDWAGAEADVGVMWTGVEAVVGGMLGGGGGGGVWNASLLHLAR